MIKSPFRSIVESGLKLRATKQALLTMNIVVTWVLSTLKFRIKGTKSEDQATVTIICGLNVCREAGFRDLFQSHMEFRGKYEMTLHQDELNPQSRRSTAI